ncbi:hypothetical protein DFA_00862 [Cavenderia fasciculata]|uniref:Ricin B lectin domain-containing protein n=1 Tax=Cavenderia fasciculata TaxID=261658 RepID=F4PU67_CACFS|nr:uncharacterized protein DFA_00862 [Cavenderia fasciculata]EGG20993.1 hypothetical protein DFA_00862 [Cavenderia fasciculata]|eukprot:XP_004358843.1 hypothetical protein DFA_00862 [Cavenderia fasciculata]
MKSTTFIIITIVLANILICNGDFQIKTPYSYSFFKFPTVLNKKLSSVEFQITINTDPGFYSNIFWSFQFDLFGGSSSGHIGIRSNGGTTRQFIFSVWDAIDSFSNSSNTKCSTFNGGEGEKGHHCVVEWNWQVGHPYKFTISQSPNNLLNASVIDINENKTYQLGSIKSTSNFISTENMLAMVGYFDNGENANCENQPYSSASFDLPRGYSNGSQHMGVFSSTDYNPNCQNVAVTIIGLDNIVKHLLGTGNSVRSIITPHAGYPKKSDTCLGMTNDGQVLVTSCTSNIQQQWVMSADGSIRSNNDYCLDIGGGSLAQNASVIAYPCHDGTNQKWKIDGYRLKSQYSGYCITHANTHDIKVSSCDSDQQEWNLPYLY